MQYEVDVGGRVRRVVVNGSGGRLAVEVDGRAWRVDAARIDAHTLSLIVDRVWPEDDRRASYEVAVTPGTAPGQLTVHVGSTPVTVTLNGRRRRPDAAGHAGNGPQRLVAPMPGKVVRVLVQTGDSVRARQPLVVVEAMKMENELRAGRDGVVAGIHVREGASVEAGALLVEIT